MTNFIKAPLINVNEETAILVEWHHNTDDQVQNGETICLLETAKSTFEVQAEQKGFLIIFAQAGDTVKVGQIIGAIVDQPGQKVDRPAMNSEIEESRDNAVRWTKKAELVARRHQLDINDIADHMKSERVSENDVVQYISDLQKKNKDNKFNHYHKMERILILGGGNVAVLVLDILSRIPYQQPVAILDDNPKMHGRSVLGCPVVGPTSEAVILWKDGFFDAATIAIGALPLRAQIFEDLSEKGVPFTNIIDPSALVLSDVTMGNGNMIMGFCRIGPQSQIGNNNFLSAYVNVEHHNILGNHCTFGPGVFTSGGVSIGNQVRFGTGVFVEPRIVIEDFVTIASGVILTTNVPQGTTVKTKANFIFSR